MVRLQVRVRVRVTASSHDSVSLLSLLLTGGFSGMATVVTTPGSRVAGVVLNAAK